MTPAVQDLAEHVRPARIAINFPVYGIWEGLVTDLLRAVLARSSVLGVIAV